MAAWCTRCRGSGCYICDETGNEGGYGAPINPPGTARVCNCIPQQQSCYLCRGDALRYSVELKSAMREYADAAHEMLRTLAAAVDAWPSMNSAHEGYGVLAEEVAELFDEVRLKQSKRTVEAMRKECLDVAAMAIRMAVEVCKEPVIRK